MKSEWKKTHIAGGFILAVIIILIVINVVWMAQNWDDMRPVGQGSHAPAFSLEDLQNKSVRLQDLRGHVVLLNFWASWCSSCMRKMPFLERMQKEFQPQGLVILAINVEQNRDRVKQFVEMGTDLRILIDNGEVAARYGVHALPHAVLIDRHGQVVYLQIGGGGEHALQRQITSLLNRSTARR